MPSPANPHRSSFRGESAKPTPARTKFLDLGPQLGPYDTNTVRSKIRKWQQQGGGVVTANDTYYDDEDNAPPTRPKPDLAKENAGSKRSNHHASGAGVRNRSSSTPRKRVISDEHWRINRSTTQSPKPKRPSPNKISTYTSNDELMPPRGGREKKNDKKDEKVKPIRSPRSAESARTSRTSPLSSRGQKDSKFQRTIGEKIEEEETPRPADAGKSQSTVASELDEDGSEWAAREADSSSLSRSSLSRKRERDAHKKHRELETPPKGGIFAHMIGESRVLLENSAPPKAAAPQQEGRLETWLSNAFDPFLEDDELSAEIPAPLNPKSTKPGQSPKREFDYESVSDPKSSPDGSNRKQKCSISRRVADKEDSPAAKRERSAAHAKKPSGERRKGTNSPPSRKKANEHESHKQSTEDKEKDTGSDVVQHAESDAETHPLPDGSEKFGNNAPVPLGRLRPFPGTGIHQLSTIPSIDTLRSSDCGKSQTPPYAPLEKRDSTSNGIEAAILEERDQFDPDSLSRVSSKLRRRLATHDDLMSVLSDSNSGRSIRSARSVRTNRSHLGAMSMGDLLQDLFTDEAKYMRELKTLVGGVIPVLLACVLSRSDSAVAAGLFRPSADPKDDVNFTKPIVDMGITLERLKTLHKRIPQDNADSLLHWAQGAQRVYRDYLKAWRLGFKDVVVNLAPQEEGEVPNDSDTRSLDEGMERDENGDVVGSDGEKVDVAYLLKRPLVRLKYLAKSLRGISTLQPSAKTEEIAMAYQDLVAEARRRAREERARLEDESAASVDATRARDPMTMAVLTDVTVDRSRRVRARDFFNLSLYHSSGQAVDCRAEFLLRDNIPENGPGGDLLICEVDHAERWLLFPPIDLRCVSARNGDTKEEIIVMLRSSPGQARNWQELLLLQVDEEGIGSEWVQMLGTNPSPPQICRSQSFINRTKHRPREEPATNKDASSSQKIPTSPSDVDIPMGEKKAKSGLGSGSPTKQSTSIGSSSSPTGSRDSLQTAITQPSDDIQGGFDQPTNKRARPPLPSVFSSNYSGEEKAPTLKRSKAKRVSRLAEFSSLKEQSPSAISAVGKEKVSPSTRRYHDEPKHSGPSLVPASKSKTPPSKPTVEDTFNSSQPPRVSSVPSMELPVIPKLRDGSSSSLLPESSSNLSDEDDDPYGVLDEYELESPPDAEGAGEAPVPPPHRSPSSGGQDHLDVPASGGRLKRHRSSPLKHEYEPSTASDSYSSDGSTVRHYDLDDSSSYLTSDYSATESESESCSDVDDHGVATSSQPGTDVPASSLSPSKSVSQGAYRTVPIQPSKSLKVVASVFAWSDTGTWTNLFPGDCSVAVSPGLVEAYEMSANPNMPKDNEDQPLVALELTPLVPIRRGTAIDISIRSPPTQRSKVLSSNNIMFRSRNAEECDELYCLINQARINNPTYIALQNARGPFDGQPVTFETPNENKSGWLFSWPRRRKSYRASPSSPRSTADVSESSVGTMSSAFSALKRFGAGNKVFSIARSTVTSKKGGKGESSNSGSGGFGSTPSPSSGIGRIAAAIRGADGVGLSNAKIRLYARETHSKWRDMGAARLTVLPGPSQSSDSPRPGTAISGRSDHLADAFDSPESRPGPGPSIPRHGTGPTKRILVCGKTRGEVLLDVCLGESSFERVARTGIAVSVWEENEGGAPAKKQGGVTVGAYKIYMIQMKSEAEAAYTFGLVGKLKY